MRQSLVPLIALLLGLAGAALALAGADVRFAAALIVAATVFLWATLVVPEYYTALVFIAAVLVLGL